MTKRTTESWEALLNGTTPGPWARSESPWEPHVVRTADQERWVAMTKDGDDGVDKDALADTHLIAAAPEAVAEVVRLRRALEGWRGNLEHHLKWTLRSDVREIEHLESKIESITRILEGHNDEVS